MGDLISRQAAIDVVRKCQVVEVAPAYMLIDKAEVMTDLMLLPSAQPERKTGRWIYGEDDVAMCDGYHCSECGFFVPWDYKRKFIDFIKDYNFCPNCGSPMEKEGEW